MPARYAGRSYAATPLRRCRKNSIGPIGGQQLGSGAKKHPKVPQVDQSRFGRWAASYILIPPSKVLGNPAARFQFDTLPRVIEERWANWWRQTLLLPFGNPRRKQNLRRLESGSTSTAGRKDQSICLYRVPRRFVAAAELDGDWAMAHRYEEFPDDNGKSRTLG